MRRSDPSEDGAVPPRQGARDPDAHRALGCFDPARRHVQRPQACSARHHLNAAERLRPAAFICLCSKIANKKQELTRTSFSKLKPKLRHECSLPWQFGIHVQWVQAIVLVAEI